MSLAELHPARLVSRALDGAFGASEIAALLVRVGLYGQTGRLLVSQGQTERAFEFRNGQLVAVESSAPAEALDHFLAKLLAFDDPRAAASRSLARERDVSLRQILRRREVPAAAELDAALRAQASAVVAGCIHDGDALAWFDRHHEPAEDDLLDLRLFGAVWSTVVEWFAPADRTALARLLLDKGLRVNEAAQPYLRHVEADAQVRAVLSVAAPSSERDLAALGGLVLCGLVGSRTAPSGHVAWPVQVPSASGIGPPNRRRSSPQAHRGRTALVVLAVALSVSAAAAVIGLGLGRAFLEPESAAAPELETLMAQAQAALRAERPQEAIALLRRALERSPQHAPAQRALGIAYTLSGETALAEQAYRRYLALDPQAPDRAEVQRWLDYFARKKAR